MDDYQFLPFYFGSSQLAGSALEPKDIPDMDAMTTNKDNYLLCAAIDHINKVIFLMEMEDSYSNSKRIDGTEFLTNKKNLNQSKF